MPRGSTAPIENSPPGIHFIPSGDALGGAAAFTVVGAKDAIVDGGGALAGGGGSAGFAHETAIPATSQGARRFMRNWDGDGDRARAQRERDVCVLTHQPFASCEDL
jgi:hypothetical protein